MIFTAFAVKDVALGEFLPPYVAPNQAIGVRMFSDAVNQDESAFRRNPDDYVLYCVGEWDSASGLYSEVSKVDLVCYARDLIKKEEV